MLIAKSLPTFEYRLIVLLCVLGDGGPPIPLKARQVRIKCDKVRINCGSNEAIGFGVQRSGVSD